MTCSMEVAPLASYPRRTFPDSHTRQPPHSSEMWRPRKRKDGTEENSATEQGARTHVQAGRTESGSQRTKGKGQAFGGVGARAHAHTPPG